MKTIIISLLTLIAVSAVAQNPEIVIIKDRMTGEWFLSCSKKFVSIDERNNTGFSLSVFVDKETNQINDFVTEAVGIGNCSENDELSVLFEDGELIKMVSWKDFNCEAKSYFNLSEKVQFSFATKKIKTIRIKNGRSFDTHTQDVPYPDNMYFIHLYASLKKGVFRTITF